MGVEKRKNPLLQWHGGRARADFVGHISSSLSLWFWSTSRVKVTGQDLGGARPRLAGEVMSSNKRAVGCLQSVLRLVKTKQNDACIVSVNTVLIMSVATQWAEQVEPLDFWKLSWGVVGMCGHVDAAEMWHEALQGNQMPKAQGRFASAQFQRLHGNPQNLQELKVHIGFTTSPSTAL